MNKYYRYNLKGLKVIEYFYLSDYLVCSFQV